LSRFAVLRHLVGEPESSGTWQDGSQQPPSQTKAATATLPAVSTQVMEQPYHRSATSPQMHPPPSVRDTAKLRVEKFKVPFEHHCRLKFSLIKSKVLSENHCWLERSFMKFKVPLECLKRSYGRITLVALVGCLGNPQSEYYFQFLKRNIPI
jgi:hypothetical protein